MAPSSLQPLQGKSVLIVEDEALVAMELELILKGAGASVVGPVARINKALDLIRQNHIDAALLDLNLHGERPVAVAEALSGKRAAYVILTGYSFTLDEPCFREAPQLKKPASPKDIIGALTRAMRLS